jgi:hypothetical protein
MYISLTDRMPTPMALPLLKRVAWRYLPLLILLYLVATIDRVNVGFARLQMQSALQFSDTAYGIGAGIFFIGYMLIEVPSADALTLDALKTFLAGRIGKHELIGALVVRDSLPKTAVGKLSKKDLVEQEAAAHMAA